MKNSNRNSFKVLLLSPYPDNIKKVLEKNGDIVDVNDNKIETNLVKKNLYDYIISFGYKYILDKETINSVKRSAINLHISYLPFNRGAHPNIWSNIENTPSGVTIHLIDEGLDTGNILFQKEVFINQYDHTFHTSYDLLISEIEYLFEKKWKFLRLKECIGREQRGEGSFHFAKDLEKIKPFLKKGWDTNIYEFKTNYFKSIK